MRKRASQHVVHGQELYVALLPDRTFLVVGDPAYLVDTALDVIVVSQVSVESRLSTRPLNPPPAPAEAPCRWWWQHRWEHWGLGGCSMRTCARCGRQEGIL